MGEKVVVVGGSSGMGLAIAKMMAKLKYEVIIAGRDPLKLKKALKEIGSGKSYSFDMMVESEVAKFFKKIGSLDHLVITAADFKVIPFIKGTTKEARRYFDSKFWGQFVVAKYGAPQISKQGSITFFSGAAAQKPMTNFSTGSAVNAAIEGLCRSLAVELSPIRVNVISPGYIETPAWDTMSEKDKSKFFKEQIKILPSKSIGRPDDVAKAARFLIECGYSTGSVVHVDGGYPLV